MVGGGGQQVNRANRREWAGKVRRPKTGKGGGSGVEMPEGVARLFAEEMAAKFLATRDAGGRVNLSVVISLQPAPDEGGSKLLFADMMMRRTRKNLEEEPRATALVVDRKLKTAMVKAFFRGFYTSGPQKEFVDSSPFLRYNAYSGSRAAGVLEVVECYPESATRLPSVVLDKVKVSMSRVPGDGGKGDLPPLVSRRFSSLTSIKAVAVPAKDGHPLVFPVLALSPRKGGAIIMRPAAFQEELSDAALPAPGMACLLTMDAKSYKVEGRVERRGGYLVLLVEAAYSAMPPLVGEEIELVGAGGR